MELCPKPHSRFLESPPGETALPDGLLCLEKLKKVRKLAEEGAPGTEGRSP
jgi:hypothetical protein